MALAYTAPTWTDGSGEGISASNLQAISNCIEGLVQGSDKAVHAVSIEGSVITLTYADGTQESFSAVDLKGIVDVTEVVSDLDHDFTMTFTDGTVFTFTIKDGRDGTGIGDMTMDDYDPDEEVKDAGGIPDYVSSVSDEWHGTTSVSSGSFSFSGLSATKAYKPYCDVDGNSTNLNPTAQISSITGTSPNLTVTWTTDADEGATVKLRIIK